MNITPQVQKSIGVGVATVAINVGILALKDQKNSHAVAIIASVGLAGVAIAYINDFIGKAKATILATAMVVVAGAVSNIKSVKENKALSSSLQKASSFVRAAFGLSVKEPQVTEVKTNKGRLYSPLETDDDGYTTEKGHEAALWYIKRGNNTFHTGEDGTGKLIDKNDLYFATDGKIYIINKDGIITKQRAYPKAYDLERVRKNMKQLSGQGKEHEAALYSINRGNYTTHENGGKLLRYSELYLGTDGEVYRIIDGVKTNKRAYRE